MRGLLRIERGDWLWVRIGNWTTFRGAAWLDLAALERRKTTNDLVIELMMESIHGIRNSNTGKSRSEFRDTSQFSQLTGTYVIESSLGHRPQRKHRALLTCKQATYTTSSSLRRNLFFSLDCLFCLSGLRDSRSPAARSGWAPSFLYFSLLFPDSFGII